MPLMRDGRLAAVLFAGLRRAGPGLHATAPATSTVIGWPARVRQPAPVGGDQGWMILEHLRQLRCRLVELLDRLAAVGALRDPRLNAAAAPSVPVVAADAALESRRALIADVLANHRARPLRLQDQARLLGLSPSRCSRVVHAAFGTGFSRLVSERRLALAADLLGNTRLAIAEVAARSGYRDRSRFHRAFRDRYGTTPADYRRHGAW
jgi:AraC-like DNA-binding protein